MPVPWVQIVRLMPSILEVSRELLKRSRRPPPGEQTARADMLPASATPEARITALEENERRQAELVTTMADQLAQLTTAVTALHVQMRRLVIGQVATAAIAVIAIVLALR
jgi:uncharacterized coiled-coil protein SlyX